MVGNIAFRKKDRAKESMSVVIPAYNEEETVESVTHEVVQALSKITKDYELVLINDGSTDKTREIIDRLARKKRYIRAVHHKTNRGFTGAMRTAFASAKKDLVFLAPADGQFDFRELKSFIAAIGGHDVAIAYRVKNEESFSRKVNSRLFHLLCKVLFGIHLKEIPTVSLWRRGILQSIKIESDDRSAMMLPELIYKAIQKKYKFTEIPIHWHERRGGRPKGASPKMIAKTLIEMIKFWLRSRSWK